MKGKLKQLMVKGGIRNKGISEWGYTLPGYNLQNKILDDVYLCYH